MTEFQTSPENPFELKPGDTKEVAFYNRVAAVNRINYIMQERIPGFDLRTKPRDYWLTLDKEMWNRYYSSQTEPKKISESFCKRSAEVCIALEKGELNTDGAEEYIHKEYIEYRAPKLVEPPKIKFIDKVVKLLNGWK